MTPEAMKKITEGTREAFRRSMNEEAERSFKIELACRQRIEEFNREQARLASLPQPRIK